MLPGCSTMAFLTVLRNDRWTHRLARSVRGIAVSVHYIKGGEFPWLPESSWKVPCVTLWKMLSDTTQFMPRSAAIFHHFICRLHLSGSEQVRRNVQFISKVSCALWWSSVSVSLFSWGIHCGRPFVHFQVALHWHLVFFREDLWEGGQPERFKLGRQPYKTNRGQVRSKLGQACVCEVD